jgi:hypothetical protein
MPDLSEGALKILRHLKTKRVGEYEYPNELAKLFGNPKDCEDAEAELEAARLIELGAEPPFPLRHRIRHATLTPEGERYDVQ